MTPRIRAKVDDNQPEIVNQLRSIPGVTVWNTHQLGKGFPDIIVGYKGVNYLFEIKNRHGKLLIPLSEQEFYDNWQGQTEIVYDLDEILEVMGLT